MVWRRHNQSCIYKDVLLEPTIKAACPIGDRTTAMNDLSGAYEKNPKTP